MAEGLAGREDLKAELERARAEGRRIVFTNGCFDILHPGHVRYLRRARALGDLLVIGLNSDASVSRIKPGRPVNPETERAEVLAALRMVDHVVLFHEDTPYELIKELKPDMLVKGGDWEAEDIVGSDIVPDTRSLPYEEGFSTTSLINRILASNELPPEDWTEAFVTYDSMEAGIVRDLLESGEIETRMVSLKVGPYPVNVGRMGEIKLYVHESDAEKAEELLGEYGG
jgi:D-beta-D-heptose 7-phosphate kinase/D-beta-D-heptose 1-phosphate adenosyltransferase